MTSQNSRRLILIPLTFWNLLAASTSATAQSTPAAVEAPIPAVIIEKVNAVVDALAGAGLGRDAEKVQMPLTGPVVWRALQRDFDTPGWG